MKNGLAKKSWRVVRMQLNSTVLCSSLKDQNSNDDCQPPWRRWHVKKKIAFSVFSSVTEGSVKSLSIATSIISLSSWKSTSKCFSQAFFFSLLSRTIWSTNNLIFPFCIFQQSLWNFYEDLNGLAYFAVVLFLCLHMS